MNEWEQKEVRRLVKRIDKFEEFAQAVLLFAAETGLAIVVEEDAAEGRMNTPEARLLAAINKLNSPGS